MSDEKTCPNCGAALMPGDIFCGECGSRVQASAYDAAAEPLAKEPSPAVEEAEPVPEPAAVEYMPPPAAEPTAGGSQAVRIVAIVVAVGLLLLSLCLCSFGAISLFSESSDMTRGENLGFALAICFAPGVIVGLLGAGAAYFGFKRS